MAAFFSNFVSALWAALTEAGVWLLAGFFLAGLIHALVPMSWIRRQLSGRGGVFKAALLGAPIPLCSCSVIPVASSLRASGASKGASASFAISTPETGVDTVALTWGMMGPVLAIARPVAAVVTAALAGLLIDAGGPKDAPEGRGPEGGAPAGDDKTCCASTPEPVCCAAGDDGHCADAPPVAEQNKLLSALRYGYAELPKDLAWWLIAGFVIAALISAAVPEAWIANLGGTRFGPKVLMLLVGLPLYVCASASTPIAASLIAGGVSPGAALVFLLAGPATNAATVSWALKDLGGRAVAIYIASIALVSLGAGVALDAFFPGAGGVAREIMTHEHVAAWWQVAAGAALAALIVWAGGVKLAARLRRGRVSS